MTENNDSELSFDTSLEKLVDTASQLSDVLDVNSKKILSIENVLKKNKINVRFDYEIENEESQIYTSELKDHPDVIQWQTFDVTYLSWDSYSVQNGSYRFLLKKTRTTRGLTVKSINFFVINTRAIIFTPLIELKLIVRLKCAKYVYPFLMAITKHLELVNKKILEIKKANQ